MTTSDDTLAKARRKDLVTAVAIGELRKEIDHYCKLGDRVIDQAGRRVLQGEQVPNAERFIPSLKRLPSQSEKAEPPNNVHQLLQAHAHMKSEE